MCIRDRLKDAPIIVLDEATTALDPANEALIQNAVDTLVQSKTLVVIAHRLNTVIGADPVSYTHLQSVPITICVFIPLLLAWIALAAIHRIQTPKMKAFHDNLEKMNTAIVEYIKSMPIVKIFNITMKSYLSLYNAIQMCIRDRPMGCFVLPLLPLGPEKQGQLEQYLQRDVRVARIGAQRRRLYEFIDP